MIKMSFVKIAAVAALGAAVSVTGVQAASFPSKDVKIIVPFKPGGGVDTTNRILAEIANKKKMLGKYKLEIENRPSSVVGQAFAARAKPDGYTVLAMTSSVVTNPKIKNTPFTLASFEPVGFYMLTAGNHLRLKGFSDQDHRRLHCKGQIEAGNLGHVRSGHLAPHGRSGIGGLWRPQG